MKSGRRTSYLVTIGTFDGVHRGHQKLMRWVIRRARSLRLKTRVVFFVEPPRFRMKPSLRVPLLTSSRERTAILRSLGIHRVEVLRFGPRWQHMPHTRFFEEYIVGRWRAGGVLVGKDFAFGEGRRGDLDYLREACREHGMTVGVLPLARVNGRKISSSDIRERLIAGRVARAARLLGRPYAVEGRVMHGAGMGVKLGFPTANLRVSKGLLVPRGVFHVRAQGRALGGARDAVCNVGVKPTLRGRRRVTVEVHVPGWSGELYGRRIRIEFLRMLRKERKFPSLSALIRQIRRDVAKIAG